MVIKNKNRETNSCFVSSWKNRNFGKIYKAISYLLYHSRLKAIPSVCLSVPPSNHFNIRPYYSVLYSLNQKCLLAIWAGLSGPNWPYCVGNWMCAGSGCVGRTCLLEALCAGGGTTRLYVWYGACDTNTADRR